MYKIKEYQRAENEPTSTYVLTNNPDFTEQDATDVIAHESLEFIEEDSNTASVYGYKYCYIFHSL